MDAPAPTSAVHVDENLDEHVYNSVHRLRADAWSSLEEATRRLATLPRASGARADLDARVEELLDLLGPIESCWASPGRAALDELRSLHRTGERRKLMERTEELGRAGSGGAPETVDGQDPDPRPVFEVLLVDEVTPDEERSLRARLRELRRRDDEFAYELVVVDSFEDAVIASLVNVRLQAVVIGRRFADRSRHDLRMLRRFFDGTADDGGETNSFGHRVQRLGARLAAIRPELDLYLLADGSVEALAGFVDRRFARVFHTRDGLLELHLSILEGVGRRFRAPFFAALEAHSRRPTGVFHALPISRGSSVAGSPWLPEMTRFYGMNTFLAETSATSGGLDSLLDPTGPLREAQELAAQTFGAQQTYFVTNGTSTANKIVVQALVRPGDIVLVDRNCHKSHHYGLVLAGAHVVYLDSYPLDAYGMYGAVPVEEIKRKLLEFRKAGTLHRVRMLMLTNCTFDGVVYHPARVMEECLALHPDLAFLWDEAWFAFARFHPVYRPRTAMAAAGTLRERFRDPAYRARCAEQRRELGQEPDDDTLLTTRLLPDPDRARVRVYATQSTHKTLTSLRQGSMIHVHDQDFHRRAAETFREAYMTHTSTSPSYQILASLDLGRRQAALEGFGLVRKQVEQGGLLRDAVEDHPLLSRYLHFLTTPELIPARYRSSGVEQPLRAGQAAMARAWEEDEFVLDPTRATLSIGATGIDGDTFKHEHLMNRHGVQINKSTRNTLLFMTNIGTTRSTVAYLIETLVRLVRGLEDDADARGPREQAAHRRRVAELTSASVPLPDFSAFHPAFRPGDDGRGGATPEGDMRAAFYLAYDDAACEYLSAGEAAAALAAGRELVSATFVTPYPPGFPVLVPGQVVSAEVLAYMAALDTREIHGYHPDQGYRVFTEEAIRAHEGVAARAATPV
ncbi:ornithine decarboxylase [Streptacidiphilus pinicola]|uniref:Ornithine decarboxylase n=1 Tax=Streptacidiphilus pinicola TaxID=2219663 RepID=A0A2X0IGP1_9ACTN|nr:aminotransferase class I/II-fold pyridoxal phosphate-dependent enzyme [Streptacidiphilus pinicola]RAG83717.1 ornithine decarboxylase [Streptacidiphilus pinicola]